MNVLIARLRVVLVMLGVLLILVGLFADVGWLELVGFVVLVVGLACCFVFGRIRAAPRRVRLPVTGRWVALNSPANRVPSHGLHAYGQTYALDLVYEAGQHIADCGNSGNSTEPHLHVQLMDHPRVAVAAGLPVEFENFEVEGQRQSGLPRNGEPFVVAPPR